MGTGCRMDEEFRFVFLFPEGFECVFGELQKVVKDHFQVPWIFEFEVMVDDGCARAFVVDGVCHISQKFLWFQPWSRGYLSVPRR